MDTEEIERQIRWRKELIAEKEQEVADFEKQLVDWATKRVVCRSPVQQALLDYLLTYASPELQVREAEVIKRVQENPFDHLYVAPDWDQTLYLFSGDYPLFYIEDLPHLVQFVAESGYQFGYEDGCGEEAGEMLMDSYYPGDEV